MDFKEGSFCLLFVKRRMAYLSVGELMRPKTHIVFNAVASVIAAVTLLYLFGFFSLYAERASGPMVESMRAQLGELPVA